MVHLLSWFPCGDALVRFVELATDLLGRQMDLDVELVGHDQGLQFAPSPPSSGSDGPSAFSIDAVNSATTSSTSGASFDGC